MSQSSSLADQLNVTLFPVPDPPGSISLNNGTDYNNNTDTADTVAPEPKKWCDRSFYPESVCQCELHEVCAVHLTGCSSGCSGDSLGKLAKFLGCYAKGEGTGDESCKPNLMASCAASAGIAGGAKAMTSCAKDKSTTEPIVREAWEKSQKVQTYPYSTLNGKVLPQGVSATQLKKALCKAGAKAAC